MEHLSLPEADSDCEDGVKRSGPALVEKLKRLKGDESTRMLDIFEQFPIAAHALHDLRPSRAPSACSIELTDCAPIAVKMHRESPRHDEEPQKQLKMMLEAVVIARSTSPWAFPIAIASKQDGAIRLCINFKPLNLRMKKDGWPLPSMDEILEALAGEKRCTTLDLFAGYWQTRLAEELKKFATFRCKFGARKLEAMPFGLKNAPPAFQRIMTALLEDLPYARVYIDDIVIFSDAFEKHAKHVSEVLFKLDPHGYKIKLKKCSLVQQEACTLGHAASEEGVKIDGSKIEKVANWKRPTSPKEARSFAPLASCCRKFISGFVCLAEPLHQAGSRSAKEFAWDDECERSFALLKKAAAARPALKGPDLTKPFIVYADARKCGVRAILAQADDDGAEHPIAFGSRGMSEHERKRSVAHKEGLAAAFAVKKHRRYLLRLPFKLIANHQPLKWMLA